MDIQFTPGALVPHLPLVQPIAALIQTLDRGIAPLFEERLDLRPADPRDVQRDAEIVSALEPLLARRAHLVERLAFVPALSAEDIIAKAGILLRSIRQDASGLEDTEPDLTASLLLDILGG
jgi:hypothetical protein